MPKDAQRLEMRSFDERLIASHSLFHVAIGEQLISPNKEPQRLCPLLRLVAMKQTVSDSRLKTLVIKLPFPKDSRGQGRNLKVFVRPWRVFWKGLRAVGSKEVL